MGQKYLTKTNTYIDCIRYNANANLVKSILQNLKHILIVLGTMPMPIACDHLPKNFQTLFFYMKHTRKLEKKCCIQIIIYFKLLCIRKKYYNIIIILLQQ